MPTHLLHRPLLCFTFAVIAGIGLAAAGVVGVVIAVALFVPALILLVLASSRPYLALLGLLLADIACGALRYTADTSISPRDICHWAGQEQMVTLTGTVADDPEERPGRTVLRLRAERISVTDAHTETVGLVYVTVAQMPGERPTPFEYGDRVTLHGPLDLPRRPTNPGAFDWRAYLAQRGIHCTLNARGPITVQPGSASTNPLLLMAWTLRRAIVARVRAALPPEPAAVLCGILIGRRFDLSPDLTADFMHTGTIHILASAGLHVGILAYWLMLGFHRLTVPRKWSVASVIGLLMLYDVLAGGRPSVTRAVIMAAVYLGAILFERAPDIPTSIAFAALLILLGQPSALFDSGFQLSFLTVITLAATLPIWHAFCQTRLPASPKHPLLRKAALHLLDLLGLSVLAQLGSAPIVAAAYNELSLSGLLANLLVVPALFVIIPIGFLSILLSCITPILGTPFFAITHLALRYVIAVVRACGESDWAYRAIETPGWWVIGAYYGVVWGGGWWVGRGKKMDRQSES